MPKNRRKKKTMLKFQANGNTQEESWLNERRYEFIHRKAHVNGCNVPVRLTHTQRCRGVNALCKVLKLKQLFLLRMNYTQQQQCLIRIIFFFSLLFCIDSTDLCLLSLLLDSFIWINAQQYSSTADAHTRTQWMHDKLTIPYIYLLIVIYKVHGFCLLFNDGMRLYSWCTVRDRLICTATPSMPSLWFAAESFLYLTLWQRTNANMTNEHSAFVCIWIFVLCIHNKTKKCVKTHGPIQKSANN